jgi:6-pyruvoyltetrahydropterin/6-carboxytetrahydropterin synthase
MRLTTLQRFEFSAAHQLRGEGLESRLHGHNFALWVGVSGPTQPATGRAIPLADLTAAVQGVLARYNYRHLNTILGDIEPTHISVVRALWSDLQPALGAPLALDSITLLEEGGPGFAVTSTGAAGIVTGEFSAAHRTHAPRLSDAENLALYGASNNPAGHGHNYRAELHLPPGAAVPHDLWAEFDHKNLSADIPDLRGRNVVTEAIAKLVAQRVPQARRVRVWETAAFFAEYDAAEACYRLGRRYRFNAAHRLHNSRLSPEENRRLYGSCHSPDPHGHTYLVEITVAGVLDPRTETAYDLGQLDQWAGDILSALDYTDLDDEAAAFRDDPSTGENIAAYLWSRFADRVGPALEAVSVWEAAGRAFRVEAAHKAVRLE